MKLNLLIVHRNLHQLIKRTKTTITYLSSRMAKTRTSRTPEFFAFSNVKSCKFQLPIRIVRSSFELDPSKIVKSSRIQVNLAFLIGYLMVKKCRKIFWKWPRSNLIHLFAKPPHRMGQVTVLGQKSTSDGYIGRSAEQIFIHGHKGGLSFDPPRGGGHNYYFVKSRKTVILHYPFTTPGTIMYLDENFLFKKAAKVKFTLSLFDPRRTSLRL